MQSQRFLVSHIPANARVLIVGGGSGKLLEEIATIHPEGLEIYYVEISSKMMDKAKKRNAKYNKVHYMQQGMEEFNADKKFDVIITPFLFDNFKDEKIKLLFAYLNSLLMHDGLWLHVDFTNTDKTWQKLLLKTMYIFFKILTGIEANKLLEIEYLFTDNYYKITAKLFYNGFIKASVYQKHSSTSLSKN